MYDGKGTDFVLLCEFSEKDGPVPRELLGTPSVGFPLDQFAVKLMSVEMKIEVGEKWSAWCEWKAQGVEYLVVHFQLHDLDARGYSRQLVFAYISYHQKKLIKHRNIYLEALNYAADMMMEANKMDWKFELFKRISDLQLVYLYIKMEQFHQLSSLSSSHSAITSLPQPPKGEPTKKKTKQARPQLSKPSAIKTFESGEDLPFPSPNTLETTYIELKKLQRQIKGGGKLFKTEKRSNKPNATSHAPDADSSSPFDSFYRQKISQQNEELNVALGSLKIQVPSSDHHLRSNRATPALDKRKRSGPRNPLRELYEPWKLETKAALKNGEAIFSIVEPSQEQLGHVYSLHYKNTLYDKSLRSIWQLCPPALTRSLSLLRGLLDGFSHCSVVLDHILAEHKQLLRSPSSLLAIGEVPIINFDLDAINATTPTPASLRWLSQSKVQSPVSLGSLELGGLDAIHMSNGPRNSNRFSFASLPSYLPSSRPNPPSSIFAAATIATPTLLSPIGAPTSFSAHPSLEIPTRTLLSARTSSSGPGQHPLSLLAESVGLSRIGMKNEAMAASSPTSGASYIAPGAPLISELSMATANAYLSHRLDYLAADLTSISTLLWPSSSCPSAYFPSQGPGAPSSMRTSPNATGLAYDTTFSKNIGLAASNAYLSADPAMANYDFGSFLGLGTAASSAALASGALSLSLTMSPSGSLSSTGMALPPSHTFQPSQPHSGSKAELYKLFKMRNVPISAPSTFTSCVACKHAAVDSLLVQLQHDAICIKSGEDEATHIWNVKWSDMARPSSTVVSRTHSSSSSTDFQRASSHLKAQETQENEESKKSLVMPSTGPQSAFTLSNEATDGSQTREMGSDNGASENKVNKDQSISNSSLDAPSVIPDIVSPDPMHAAISNVLEPLKVIPPSNNARNAPNSTSLPASASTSPMPLSQPSFSATSSPAPNGKKSSSQAATSASGNRKSTSFASLLSGGGGSSGKDATSQTTAAPLAPIAVSEMNLLHLRNRFSFLRHVIFSLLKGRPVVIHAEARNRPWVEQVIASLACFVPGHHLSGDSVSQTLFQLDPSASKASTTPQYIIRQPQMVKIIHWRDARDVIFESIHSQSPSGSSTKSRLKHTKLVITRFLQLHLQKMQSYSTFAKQDSASSSPSSHTSPLSTTIPEHSLPSTASSNTSSIPTGDSSSLNNDKTKNPSRPPTPATTTTSGAYGSSSQLNIPTLSMASRQAIKLSQLSHLKLIGLDKSCPVPKTVERHVTYWDWEAEELTCVAYEKGKLLDAMINPKKQWPDEASYRAHIHFHLSDLASRAWMYYHMCCIGLFVGGIGNSNGLAVSQLPVPSPMQQVPSQPQSHPMVSYQYDHTPPLSGAGASAQENALSSLSGSQLSPTTPKKSSSPSTQGGTSPNAVATDLGFEPTSALRNQNSSPSHPSNPPSTPTTLHHSSKSIHSSTAMMGPSLSNAPSFDSASPIPSLSATPSLAREPSFSGLSSSSPFKGASPTTGKGGRISKSGSSSNMDPRGTIQGFNAASSSSSASSSAQTAISPPTAADFAFQAQMLQQRTKTAYFQSLKLSEHDCDIIEYLAELIKMQQAQEMKGQVQTFQSFSNLQVNDLIALSIHSKYGDTYSNTLAVPNPNSPSSLTGMTSQTIKLDFTATRKFKNMQLN